MVNCVVDFLNCSVNSQGPAENNMPSDMRLQCPLEDTPPSTRPPSVASSAASTSGTPHRSTSMDSLHTNSSTSDKPTGEEFIPTRLIRPTPKANANAMQFVKTGPAMLHKSAKEQMKKVEIVKTLRKTSLQEEEEWQSSSSSTKVTASLDEGSDWQTNLDKWKSSRRKRNEDVLERVIEVKKNEQDDEFSKTRRKSKTFSEMREDKNKRGRRYNLVVHDDDNNDLSDLGLSGARNGQSLSDAPEEGEAKSDAGFCTGSDTGSDGVFAEDNISDTSSALGDKREIHDSLLDSGSLSNTQKNSDVILNGHHLNGTTTTADTSISTCSVISDEYTYDKAIEDYKQFAENSVKKRTSSVTSLSSNASGSKDEQDKTSVGKKTEDKFSFYDGEVREAKVVRRDRAATKVDIGKRRSMFELRDIDQQDSRKVDLRRSMDISSTLRSKVASFENVNDSDNRSKAVKPLRDTKFKEKLESFSKKERFDSSLLTQRKTPERDQNFYQKLQNFTQMEVKSSQENLSSRKTSPERKYTRKSIERKISPSRVSSDKVYDKKSPTRTSSDKIYDKKAAPLLPLKERIASFENLTPSNSPSRRELSMSMENLHNKLSSPVESSRAIQSSQSVTNLFRRTPSTPFMVVEMDEEVGTGGAEEQTCVKRNVSRDYEVKSSFLENMENAKSTKSPLEEDTSNTPPPLPDKTRPRTHYGAPTRTLPEIPSKPARTLPSSRSIPETPLDVVEVRTSRTLPEIPKQRTMENGTYSEGYPQFPDVPSPREPEFNLLPDLSSFITHDSPPIVPVAIPPPIPPPRVPTIEDPYPSVSSFSTTEDSKELAYGDEDIDEVINNELSLESTLSSDCETGDGAENGFENISRNLAFEKVTENNEKPVNGIEESFPQHYEMMEEVAPLKPRRTPSPPLPPKSKNLAVFEVLDVTWTENNYSSPAAPPSIPPPPPPPEEEEEEDDPTEVVGGLHLSNSSPTPLENEGPRMVTSQTSTKQELRKLRSDFLGTNPRVEEEPTIEPPPDLNELLRQERDAERLIVQKQASLKRESPMLEFEYSLNGLSSSGRSKYTWEDRMKADGPKVERRSHDDSVDSFEFHAPFPKLSTAVHALNTYQNYVSKFSVSTYVYDKPNRSKVERFLSGGVSKDEIDRVDVVGEKYFDGLSQNECIDEVRSCDATKPGVFTNDDSCHWKAGINTVDKTYDVLPHKTFDVLTHNKTYDILSHSKTSTPVSPNKTSIDMSLNKSCINVFQGRVDDKVLNKSERDLIKQVIDVKPKDYINNGFQKNIVNTAFQEPTKTSDFQGVTSRTPQEPNNSSDFQGLTISNTFHNRSTNRVSQKMKNDAVQEGSEFSERVNSYRTEKVKGVLDQGNTNSRRQEKNINLGSRRNGRSSKIPIAIGSQKKITENKQKNLMKETVSVIGLSKIPTANESQNKANDNVKNLMKINTPSLVDSSEGSNRAKNSHNNQNYVYMTFGDNLNKDAISSSSTVIKKTSISSKPVPAKPVPAKPESNILKNEKVISLVRASQNNRVQNKLNTGDDKIGKHSNPVVSHKDRSNLTKGKSQSMASLYAEVGTNNLKKDMKHKYSESIQDITSFQESYEATDFQEKASKLLKNKPSPMPQHQNLSKSISSLNIYEDGQPKNTLQYILLQPKKQDKNPHITIFSSKYSGSNLKRVNSRSESCLLTLPNVPSTIPKNLNLTDNKTFTKNVNTANRTFRKNVAMTDEFLSKSNQTRYKSSSAEKNTIPLLPHVPETLPLILKDSYTNRPVLSDTVKALIDTIAVLIDDTTSLKSNKSSNNPSVTNTTSPCPISQIHASLPLHAYEGGQGPISRPLKANFKGNINDSKLKKLAELEQEMEKHDHDMLQRLKGPSTVQDQPEMHSQDLIEAAPPSSQYPEKLNSTDESVHYQEFNNTANRNNQNMQNVQNTHNVQNIQNNQNSTNIEKTHPPLQEFYSAPVYKNEPPEPIYNSRLMTSQENLYSEPALVSREIKRAVEPTKSLPDVPPPIPRKQSILALSAIPKPKLTDNDSWIMKKKAEGGKKDYSKHWLIQEAEQRRLEQQERITRPMPIPSSKPFINLQTTPGYQNHFQNIKSSFHTSNHNQSSSTGTTNTTIHPTNDSSNKYIYNNNGPIISTSSGIPNTTSSNLPNTTPSIPPPNNNWMKQTKTYQPPQPASPTASNNKPLPDAIISSITQRVNNKINGRTPVYNSVQSTIRNDDQNYHDYMNTGSFNNSSNYSSGNSTSNPSPVNASPGSQGTHFPVSASPGSQGSHFPIHVPSLGGNNQQTGPPGSQQVPLSGEDQRLLSVSGKKKCSHCGEELGRGAAMIIESLRLFYHIPCFKCCVCGIQLGNGTSGADVRVRNHKLHCHNCYSNDEGMKFSKV